jgi:hypothetical protein
LKVSWYYGEPPHLQDYKEITVNNSKMSDKQYEDFETSVLLKMGIKNPT